nr:MBG domain-containing protein [Martelella limonii]
MTSVVADDQNSSTFAKSRGRQALRHRGWRAALLATAAFSAFGTCPAFAENALPSGGSVVTGAATIASNGSAMTVTQGSDRAIVNWQSFNVGQANSVNFVQPGDNAAILNRVTGNTRSSIAGALSGNGQVFLVNPNGIAITPTGTVKAGGGFVASTLDITNDDFMSGNMVFRGNGASGTVSNEGVVTIGRGGYAALMGGKVKNIGLIAVPYGKAGLGAGEEITLDLSGDGFMQVAVPSSLMDDGEALVENSGTVTAEGGVILMKAATARAAARHAVNLSGVAEARSVSGRNGKITLGGGAGGKVTVTGKVSTRAKAAQPKTTQGGAIEITGLEIRLDDAVIDASGYGAGGKVRIGGDWQGAGDVPHADILTVSAGTVISADAVSEGNGGSVVLWSDHRTAFAGRISATGATGTGGDAEVSGKALLSYTGFADLTSAAGFGSLLLDPYNVTISNAADQTSSGFTASGNDSVINVATLQNALAGANVTVSTGAGGSQDGDITVADAVTWASGSTLTLSAYRNIAVNANLAGGTGSQILLRADSSATGSGTVSFGSGITATADGGVSLYYNPSSYSAPVDYSGKAGGGTTLTAYMLVNTLDNLQAINTNLSGTYALGKDIDASATAGWNGGTGFEPIEPFKGMFDGDGHVISGLTINRPSVSGVGLFGGTDINASIRNIGLVDASVTGDSLVGGLVGNGYGAINNAYIHGSVSGNGAVGGLVGRQLYSSIRNSHASGYVTSSGDMVGGLVGNLTSASISGSYATAAVSGGDQVGGLVGQSLGSIRNSYATGSVTGASQVGGLAGRYSYSSSILNSYATGNVSGTRREIGGLVGSLTNGGIEQSYAMGSVAGRVMVGGLLGLLDGGTVEQSYATGVISAAGYAGGLVGAVERGSVAHSHATGRVTTTGNFTGGLVGYATGNISQSYATGNVTGDGDVGGLVGYASSGTITKSYATGGVSGNGSVGGLVGYASGNISQSYATGSVSGVHNVGGLVGSESKPYLFADSYFDTDTTGVSLGVGNNASASGVIGLSTVGARSASAYGGWDFTNAWYQAGDMRPILRSEAAAPVDGVITVSNLHQLQLVGADLSASYRLSGDIDANATNEVSAGYNASGIWGAGGFVPIGTSGSAFTGTFDGDGHVISGLTINRPGTDYVGLFGLTNFGSILRNVGLEGGSVSGNGAVGGLVGRNYSAISNAYVTGSVSGNVGVGGLAGWNGGTIENINTTGSVSGDTYVGGLVGLNNSTISNAYATGSVTGAGGNSVGGLVGLHNRGTISNAYATGSVTGTGGSSVGGLVGFNDSGTISNAHATGSVTGAGGNSVGGLVGFNDSGMISNAYATGSVTGTDGNSVGGLVGFNDSGTISNAYATGSVTGSGADIRGLIGFNNGTIENSYFDKETTGQSNGADNSSGVIGLTTAQFQDTAYFYALATDAGWNFETVWAPPSEGYYPELYALSDVVFVKTDGKTITYGDASGALTYSGVYGGHSGAGVFAPTLTTDATATSNVGSYAITGQSSFVGDDGITYRTVYGPGAVTINKATLRVTANNGSMIYGDDVPGDIGYTATGWKNGQTGALLTGVSVGTNATKTSNAGSGYATAAFGGTLSGAAAGNYAISYVGADFVVNKAPLAVTADSGSMIYGSTPPTDLGYSVSGWKNSDTGSVTGASVVTDATSSSGVGSGYVTTASGGSITSTAAGNYDLSYASGSFSVTPRALKITAKGASKTYGEVASLTAYSVNGLVNGDTVSTVTLTSMGSAASANAATYDIIASNATGSGLYNYAIDYVDGALTVAKAKLTVTAGNGEMNYGDTVPMIGYAVSGWKNGQSDAFLVGVIVTTNANPTSNVGTYYSTMAAGGKLGGAASGNYTLDHVDGKFAVTPRALTVTASDAVKTYGDKASLTGFTTAGLVNGDSVSAVSEKSLGADAEADAGVYDIIASAAKGSGLSNYDINYEKGTLTVDKAALTVTADSGSMIYGDAVPMIGYAVSGWKSGQNGSLLSGVVVTTDATSSSDAGSGYSTAASGGALSGAAAGNYDISYRDGSMAIRRRAITVAANAGAKTYGDLGLLSYTVGGMGLANGDRLSGRLESDGQAILANVGSYAVTQGSVTDAFNRNYAISYRANTLAVSPRPITLTADDAVKQLGTPAGVLGWQITAGNLVDGHASLNGSPASRGAPSSAAVGTYAITAGSLTDAENPNYAITFLPGKLEVLPVLAPSAPAGGVPLPGQQFDPFTVAGGSLQETLFADSNNPRGTLIVTEQSPVSNAACDAGPQVLFICP